MRCQLRLTFGWKGGEIIEQELSTDELVDVALGTNYAHDFDLNVDLDSVDVDVVASLIVNLSDAKRHAPLLSSFLLESYLYFGVNEIISFQKLVGNLHKMAVANLGRHTGDLCTPISRVLENICNFLEL